MNPHRDLISRLKMSRVYQDLTGTGYMNISIDKSGQNVIFDSPLHNREVVSLGDEGGVIEALERFQVAKSKLGFTMGYTLGDSHHNLAEEIGGSSGRASIKNIGNTVKGGEYKSVTEKIVDHLPESYRQRLGFYRNQKLVELSRNGYSISESTYDITSDSKDAVLKLIKDKFTGNDGELLAAVHRTGSNGLTVIRVEDQKAGRFLNIGEIYGKMGIKWGDGSNPSEMSFSALLGKGSKRARGVFQKSMLSASMSPGEMKVAIYDPKKMFNTTFKKLEEHHRNALKGFFEDTAEGRAGLAERASKEAADDVAKYVDGFFTLTDIDKMSKALKGTLMSEYRAAKRAGMSRTDARAYLDRINKEVASFRTESGRGNVRVSGDYEILKNDEARRYAPEYAEGEEVIKGQIKGDVNITRVSRSSDEVIKILRESGDEETTRFARYVAGQKLAGATLVVPSTNVVDSTNAIAGSNVFVSLTPYGSDGVVRTNIMGLTASPELYDFSKISEETALGIKSDFEGLARGELPEGFRSHLETLAGYTERDINQAITSGSRAAKESGREGMRKAIREAQSIIEAQDLGAPLLSNKYLTPQIQNALFNFRVNQAKSRFILTDAESHHFTSEAHAIGSDSGIYGRRLRRRQESVFQRSDGKSGLIKGSDKASLDGVSYMTYDRSTGSWILPTLDDSEYLSKILSRLGGADFDDAMVATFRYDPNGGIKGGGGVIKVLGTRNPTGRGENVALNIAIDDDIISSKAVKYASGLSDEVLDSSLDAEGRSVRSYIGDIERYESENADFSRQLRNLHRKTPRIEHRAEKIHSDITKAEKRLGRAQTVSSRKKYSRELENLKERRSKIEQELKLHYEDRAQLETFIDMNETLAYRWKAKVSARFAPEMFPKYSEAERLIPRFKTGYEGLEEKMLFAGEEHNMALAKEQNLYTPAYATEEELGVVGKHTVEEVDAFLKELVGGSEASSRTTGSALNYSASVDALFSSMNDPNSENFLFKGLEPKSIKVFEREMLIDATQQLGSGNGGKAAKIMAESGEAVGRELVRALYEEKRHIKLPVSLVGDEGLDITARFSAPFKKGIQAGIDAAQKDESIVRAEDAPKGLRLGYFTSTIEEDPTMTGQAWRSSEEMKAFFRDQKNILSNKAEAESYHSYFSGIDEIDEEAKALVEKYTELRKANRVDSEITQTLEKTTAARKLELNDQIIDEIYKSANTLSEDLGMKSTEIVDKLLMGIDNVADTNDVLEEMQGLTGGESKRGLGEMLVHARVRMDLEGYENRKLIGTEELGLTEEEVAYRRRILAENPITEEEIARAGDGSIRKMLRRLGDATEDVINGIRSPVDTTFREGMNKLWKIPEVKNGAIGAALLVGASVLYQHHKDVTPETHSGGDFIPGGSNYEQNYSRPGLGVPGRPYGFSGGGGTTYVVNATGASDPNALLSELEGVSGAQAYGTISTRHNPRFNVESAIASS